MAKLSKKELRKKFGQAGGPLPATRVLVKPMDHDFGVPSFSILAIDDKAGTITGANVYGGNMGKGYDPDAYRHPLPEAGSDSWKKYRKRGYEEGKVKDWDVLVQVEVKSSKPQTAKA